MAKLDERQIRDQLNELTNWSREGQAIHRSYRFDSFKSAIEFVNRVAALAEAADHHPDIDVRYRDVTLTLSTHSAGGITDKDFELARRIDERATAR
jgi:4a-hydroxytetrahydrobiopterin dehydratase